MSRMKLCREAIRGVLSAPWVSRWREQQRLIYVVWGLWCLSLSACALLVSPGSMSLGSSVSEIESRLGQPTARYDLPSGQGQRLQYSYQPLGYLVFNLDVDAQGQLVHIEQPLQREALERDLVTGRLREQDLRLRYGEPAEISRVASFNGVVWSYRFMDVGSPWFVHMHLDPQGVLRQVMFLREDDLRETPRGLR